MQSNHILLQIISIDIQLRKMDCYCHSKNLYHSSNLPSTNKVAQGRRITPKNKNPHSEQFTSHLKSTIIEKSSIYLPAGKQLQIIEGQQIYDNPGWFHKQYISLNKPCIIRNGGEELAEMIEAWRNPKDFLDACLQSCAKGSNQVSVSLTPDGFADSIKGEYFVEPAEINTTIQNVVNWVSDPEKSSIPADLIPYIQHQNSNLTQEKQLRNLSETLPQTFSKFIENNIFSGQPPDASNFWMGYEQSVSALHKDPYQNFYTTIVGEKHFTLLPPISILYLHEEEYYNAKWKYHEKSGLQFSTEKNSTYSMTKWIANNPDRKEDYEIFPEMKNLDNYCMHVILEAGDTLFLPSLWYHQVSQSHSKGDPYVIAVNHWYDMNFTHNYTLYETARAICGI